MTAPNALPFGGDAVISAADLVGLLALLETAGGRIAASVADRDVARNIRLPNPSRTYRDQFRTR